jgi:hypothetical protein
MTPVAACVFCGSARKLTGEHVFPAWLRTVGLILTPVNHGAGPLNGMLRDLGTSSPFNRKIRAVCGACNGGWMSALEAAVKPELSDAILGSSKSIPARAHAVISVWIHKTAMVGALYSADAGGKPRRALPEDEFHELHAARHAQVPLRDTQFWAGRYTSRVRSASTWLTPMVVEIDGLPPSPLPQAYLMTVQIGALLLQGVRFTSPGLFFEMSAGPALSSLWPSLGDLTLSAEPIDDEAFISSVTKGLHLRSSLGAARLRPWRVATELPASEALGTMVELPTLCEHSVRYPSALVHHAYQGLFYWFTLRCSCGTAFLLCTEPDGVHVRAVGPADDIEREYVSLTGDEVVFQGEECQLACKRASARTSA